MKFNFKQNNLNMHFEVTEDGRLYLLHCSNLEFDENTIDEKCKYRFPAVEIQLSGRDRDDHHGARHVGSSGTKSLKYVNHEYSENEYGNKLEIELADEEMKTVVHYQFYRELSVVRAWTTVTNHSDHNLGLEYISSFSLTGIGKEKKEKVTDRLHLWIPHNSWCREVDWREQTITEAGLKKNSEFATKRININNSGTWSSKEYLPLAALTDGEFETAYMWQIENNGSWQWEISDTSDYIYLKLSGPTEHENRWHKELKPGEVFESVKVAVAVGSKFDDALEQLTGYRRRIVRRNQADASLPVIFNDYMHCLWADPTTEKMIPVIDRAAEAGAEYYCMDAGWYADGYWWDTVGEWMPKDWRFPNGIKEVFDYIKSKGMVPGIWLEIESMGVNCPILGQFTDDCFFMRNGRCAVVDGRYQLDFRSEAVRKFATGVVDRVVNEYGVGYIKADYNIDGGIGTEVNADDFGDGLLGHSRALVAWFEEMLDRHPGLVIENCSSGGMRMDYAMLSKLSLQSVTDMSEYQEMIPIAAAAATALLPEQGAIWSYPLAHEDLVRVAGNMVNSMMMRMHLGGEIHKLSEEQFDVVKEGVAFYKKLRKYIKEAIPFYPLGVVTANRDWLCAGYRCKDREYMIVWRLDSEESHKTIPVVQDAANVQIVYPLNGNGHVEWKGDSVNIELKEKYSSAVIEILIK